MTRVSRFAALSGSIVLACFGIAIVQTELPVNAATVTSNYCNANVTPSTGVTVSVADNGDCVVKFTSSSLVTWTRPAGITTFEVLVVAGGGGGGSHPNGDPGGGGGGGVVHVPTTTLSGASYDVVAGAGGIGNNTPNPVALPYWAGGNGENSTFTVTGGSTLITADGGGGGGGAYITQLDGGSGGGSHCGAGNAAATKGRVAGSITGAVLYGNVGGSSFGCGDGSGGGGGATEPGENGALDKAGDGGEGIALDVLGTGTPVAYGSGGGGAGAYRDVLSQTPMVAGVGGTNGGDGMNGDGALTARNHGVTGTGGGGGAKLCPTDNPCPAGNGGSGVVIVRYTPTPIAPTSTAAPTVSGNVIVGSTLTATNGTWGGTARTYTYQWQRASSASGSFASIAGATGQSYVLTNDDANNYVRIVVTASNAAGTATSTSTALGFVVAPATTATTTVPVGIIAPEVNSTSGGIPTRNRTTAVTTARTSTSSTSTTAPVTTTTVALVTPTAPATQPGEAQVTIDGETSTATLSRSNDELIVSFGDFSSTLSAVSADGTRRALDADGNIRLEQGDALSMSATGYASDSEIEVWMFSTPTRLGVVKTNYIGTAEAIVEVVNNPKAGNHRIVLSGKSRDGADAMLTVGVIVGGSDSGVSTLSKFLIALPMVVAVIAALVIPTRRRRRFRIA
jgi:hypothetical protein